MTRAFHLYVVVGVCALLVLGTVGVPLADRADANITDDGLAVDDPGMYTNESTVTITGSATGYDTPVDITVDSPADTVTTTLSDGGSFAIDISLADGDNDIHVTADDGNQSTTQTVSITYDTDTPTVYFDSIPTAVDNETDTLTVTGTATDDQSGLDTATLAINETQHAIVEGDFTTTLPLDYGENNITLHATDNAGNTATTTTTVEREKPDLTVVLDDFPNKTADESLRISGSVGGAVDGATVDISTGAENRTWTIDDETGIFFPTMDLTDSENEITVTVLDGAGRTATANATVVSDQTPPTIHDIDAPDTVDRNEIYTLTANVSDNGTGIDTVTVNGTALTHEGGETWTALLVAPETAGDHTFNITAEDGVENTNSSTTTIHVSRDLALDVDGLPDQTTNGTITITGTVTDYYDPATVTIDTGLNTTEQTLTEGETNISAPIGLHAYENTITITATDEGDQEATETLTIDRVGEEALLTEKSAADYLGPSDPPLVGSLLQRVEVVFNQRGDLVGFSG